MTNQQIRIDKGGRVWLNMRGRSREIGGIRNRTFHCFRSPEKHIMHTGGFVGFNYELLQRDEFDRICVHFPDGAILETTREYVLAHGKFMHFQNSGFERQLFVHPRDFGIERALTWQRIQDEAREREVTRHTQLALGF